MRKLPFEPRIPRGDLLSLTQRVNELFKEAALTVNALVDRSMTPVGAAVTPAVGASPASFTAPSDGLYVVAGGTVSALDYGRSGAFVGLGVTAGPVPIKQGDVLRVTYTVAPVVRFIPQ
jgi:hypothetical protein